jgi:hypothetical protein
MTSSAAARLSVLNPREQRARLGSAASKEMVEYWENMFATASEITSKGLVTSVYGSDFVRDGVLQRIKATTLLMTADRGQAQSVQKARQYQTLIPNSQLVVVRSDAYHIAVANADGCVATSSPSSRRRGAGLSRSESHWGRTQ